MNKTFIASRIILIISLLVVWVTRADAPTTEAPSPDAILSTSETDAPSPSPTSSQSIRPTTPASYPWHTSITATIFWVGEPIGNGSSENNAISAYDDEWLKRFGCFDDPEKRNEYFPKNCIPKENSFYLDLPYSDFKDEGERKPSALNVVPWAKEKTWRKNESLMKNQWVELYNPETQQTCYGQIEDAGPYEYDDVRYVFGTKDERPKSKRANNAGLDVSPALRDCLQFKGLNNDENKVHWRFVARSEVPPGPWTQIITTSQLNWIEYIK